MPRRRKQTKKYLVTGAAGFMGSHLVPAMKSAGMNVAGIDREDGDLTDKDVVWNLCIDYQPDVIIHLAAQYGRIYSEESPAWTIRNNIEATTNLAIQCRSRGIQMVYASTSEVYGDLHGHEGLETMSTCLRPANLYGLTKLAAEHVCEMYCGPDLIILRPSMPYGPGVAPVKGRAALPYFLHLANWKHPIPVHEGAVRSWCHISDTIRAIIMILGSGEVGTFNVARDDDRRSMKEIAELACLIADAPTSLIQYVEPTSIQVLRKYTPPHRLLDMGWRPEVGLIDGMLELYEWVKKFDSDGNKIA